MTDPREQAAKFLGYLIGTGRWDGMADDYKVLVPLGWVRALAAVDVSDRRPTDPPDEVEELLVQLRLRYREALNRLAAGPSEAQ
jgi:hypothetical protein